MRARVEKVDVLGWNKSIENYVCIDYLCCHSKTSIVINSDKIFDEASYNGLLGIVITEVLMNLVSCHGFTKKPN